jgi:hypothetical protein
MTMIWRPQYLILLCASILSAGEPLWQAKPTAEWTPDDARQVLNDSPWARRVTPALLPRVGEDQLRMGGQLGGANIGLTKKRGGKKGIGQPVPLVVRWESALPVSTAALKVHETVFPDKSSDYYIVTVGDVPGVATGYQRSLPTQLKQTAYLKLHGGKEIHPSRVEIVSLGHSVVRIIYLFPRSTELGADDGQVGFVAQIGRLFVAPVFDTAEMHFLGKLEL